MFERLSQMRPELSNNERQSVSKKIITYQSRLGSNAHKNQVMRQPQKIKYMETQEEETEKGIITLNRALLRIATLLLSLDTSWLVCEAARRSATLLPSTKTSGGRSARRATSMPVKPVVIDNDEGRRKPKK